MLVLSIILSVALLQSSEISLDKQEKECIIYIEGSECPACRRFDADVWTPLFPLLRKYYRAITLKYDDKYNKSVINDITKQIRWDGSIPLICVVKNGKVIKHKIGYQKLDNFVKWMAE